jgi:hypothetical protein
MHHVMNSGVLGVVQQGLALPQHIYRVASYQEKTVNAFEGRQVGAFVIEVEDDCGDAPARKRRGFFRRANCGYDLDIFLG